LHRQPGRGDCGGCRQAHRTRPSGSHAPLRCRARPRGRIGGKVGLRIAVLRGGRSAERYVSLGSGSQVEKALRGRGHDVTGIDLDSATWDVLRDGIFACVFNALHGRFGEDGTVQGMLELLDLPYTGSGVLASALCMDKSRVNRVLAAEGLAVPAFEEVEGDEAEALVERLGLPLVLKPVSEGSTIGLTTARDEDAA